jgi:hypothetical protein
MAEDRMMTAADVVASAMSGEHGDLLRDAVALVAEDAAATSTGAARGVGFLSSTLLDPVSVEAPICQFAGGAAGSSSARSRPASRSELRQLDERPLGFVPR